MTMETTETGTTTGAASELSAGLERRCGTCEHFRRYTGKFDVEYHGKHAGTCNSDKFVYDEGSQPPLDGLRYWDYEGYSAGFEVGDQFGCIHWVRSNVEIEGQAASGLSSSNDGLCQHP
jgi:hypothetical protein